VAQLVEHHLAKVDVASSSLVTRSKPESFRGWRERTVALTKAGRPNAAACRRQGFCNALRLFVYLWRKRAEAHWVKTHEDLLQAHAHCQLVIVRRPGHKRLELEITCRSRSESSALLREFGGHLEALPRNWLHRFARTDSKPIKIGKRLIISSVGGTSVARLSRQENRSNLMIPASLAFGTGEHATTAMSLRLLEQLTRGWKRGWSVLDLGTGSGILALAAKCFGAGSITGIDNDPAAISVAKSNARLNKIRGASFQLGDLRKQKPAQKTDVITANLYNDL